MIPTKNNTTIIPVILAGGGGKRLWPVSRKECPKQFKVMDGLYSLFQKTVMRVADHPAYARPMIVASHDHHALVTEQLNGICVNEATIVLEPGGRDTAPAIVIAALLAKSRLEPGQEGYLLILPADHGVDNEDVFHEALTFAMQSGASNKLLWSIGVPPSRAETGYGYIKVGRSIARQTFQSDGFVEKPIASRAEEMVTSGKYVWNSGIFLFPIALILSEIERHFPEILASCTRSAVHSSGDDDVIEPEENAWLSSPGISIDFAVMEKTDVAGVVVADPGWSDLGNWRSYWEHSEQDTRANALKGSVFAHECSSSLIKSDGIFVAALGVENLAIIAEKDAVLVTPLDRAQDIRMISDHIDLDSKKGDAVPEFEERPWGTFESLRCKDGYQVKHICVKPGGELSLQYHHHRSEHWTVVKGEVEAQVGSLIHKLGPNQSVFIPCKAIHRLSNRGTQTVELIEVQVGGYLGEDDIVRLEDRYGRVEAASAVEVPAAKSTTFSAD